MQRPLVLLLLLALLGGCGDDDSRSGPEVVPAPSEPSAQAPVVSEPAEAPPDLQIELAAPEESADPALPDVQIKIPEPKPEPRPVPAKRPAPPKEEEVQLAEPELDLHLPEELVEELMPAPSADAARLLPPLFENGKASQSMQIGGRLISGENDDEALIDGAEIRFEFKR
jgi:outer membrane biosynthesis protein TonB